MSDVDILMDKGDACVFVLKEKPFSVNKYHYSDKRHKTKEAKAWENRILTLLHQVPYLAKWGQRFNENPTEIGMTLVFYYPKEVFHNAQGTISSRTMDLSNVEKPLLDLILGNIANVNDKYVTSLISQKSRSPDYAIYVGLKILNRD